MPQPPKAITQSIELAEALQFRREWVADPAPEIWRIVGQLDVKQQNQFTQTFLDAQITQLEAQVTARKQIQAGLANLEH